MADASIAVWFSDSWDGGAEVHLFDGSTNYPLECAESEAFSDDRFAVIGVQYQDGRLIPRDEWEPFLDSLAYITSRPRREPTVIHPVGYIRDPFTGKPAARYAPDERPEWLGELVPVRDVYPFAWDEKGPPRG